MQQNVENIEFGGSQNDKKDTIRHEVLASSKKAEIQAEYGDGKRVKLNENIDSSAKKKTKLKHQNSHSENSTSFAQQKPRSTFEKKQNPQKQNKMGLQPGQPEAGKHLTSQNSEVLFPPIKKSQQPASNDKDFLSRYPENKKGTLI